MKNGNGISADRAWISRCEDFEQYVQKYKRVRFSHFVSPHELAVVHTHFHPSAFVSVLAYGGTEDAERVMIGFFPDYQEPEPMLFPIVPLLITGISGLTHRDVLGAALGLGIKREMIGDIYIDGDRAVLMAEESIADFLQFSLKTVGRKRVEVCVCPQETRVSLVHPFRVDRRVVSSLRLDALVSCVAGVSRNEAQSLISSEGVSVNFCVTQNAALKLKESDVLSVKHHGRYVLEGILGETKKGRLAIEIKTFI